MPPAQPPRKPAPGQPPPIWDVPYDVAAERVIVGYLPDGRPRYSRSAVPDEIDEDLEQAEKDGLSPDPIAKPAPVANLDDAQRYARRVIDRAVELAESVTGVSTSDAYGAVLLRGDQVTLLDDRGPDPPAYTVTDIAGSSLILTPYGTQRSARPPFAAPAARCARLS